MGDGGDSEGFLRLSPPVDHQVSILDSGVDGGDVGTGFSDFYVSANG